MGNDFQLLDDIVKIEFKDDGGMRVRRLDVKLPAALRDSSAAVVSVEAVEGLETASLQRVEILIFGGKLSDGGVSGDAFIFTDTIEGDGDTQRPEVRDVVVAGGASKIKRGKTVPISWEASDNASVSRQFVELSTDDGATFAPVSDELRGDVRTFQWTVESGLSKTKKNVIRIRAIDGAGNEGEAASRRFKFK